jgi:hypothetical protein
VCAEFFKNTMDFCKEHPETCILVPYETQITMKINLRLRPAEIKFSRNPSNNFASMWNQLPQTIKATENVKY